LNLNLLRKKFTGKKEFGYCSPQ